MARVEVTMVRSEIGRPETQRLTLRALGLRRINQRVEHNDTPGLRGQIEKVKHLVAWKVLEG